MRVRGVWLLLIAWLLLPVTAMAQPATDPLAQRADELVALFNGGGDVAASFTPEFLAQVPAAKLRAVMTQVTSGVGPATKVAQLERADPAHATLVLATARGSVSLRLAIAADPPHRIIGLLVTGAASGEASLASIATTMQTLPGRTGFAVADLGAKPTIVAGRNVDQPLAIGSAFKLVILAELVRATAAGERHWDDPVTLDGTELPAGGYNLKPKGTVISLRKLATQMISISDNSATDVLLRLVGRERVEAMQAVIGFADPARNRPFLSTMEAFKLKGLPALRDRWLVADETGRRALLAEVDAAGTAPLAGLFADGKPVLPERIEWFLSPADLVRTMDWLRRHTESGPGAEARQMLAINPGIDCVQAAKFTYAGFKGGSEPGVISLNLLLQDKAGGWHVVTASWNDPAAPIDTARFVGLINRAAELVAQ